MYKTFLSAAILTMMTSSVCYANPQGGIVIGGHATIDNIGNKTNIHQSSQKAIIDWNSFDIAPDEHTQFHQPSSSSITLNRVKDIKPSNIAGKLSANGHIMVINPNGIVFGKESQVDVGSLTATSADIKNKEFMNGIYNFDQAGRLDAKIVNHGSITAKQAGLVNLVAPQLENSGVIYAKMGKVQLAAADTFVLDMAGDGLIQVAVSDEDAIKLASNTGYISAEGGMVAVTASGARGIVDSLVENSGIIEAKSMQRRGGKIILGGRDTNITVNNGVLDTSGRKNEAQGGQIEVLGQHVALTSHSVLDASGTSEVPVNPDAPGSSSLTMDRAVRKEEEFLADARRGGGSIKVGGDYLGTGDTPTAQTLFVDAGALTFNNGLAHGDGGRTIFWSDHTTDFNGLVLAQGGALSGHGGFLETSGKINLRANGLADLTAQNTDFNKGTYLLDPDNITIYGNFKPDDIENLQTWFDASDETQIILSYSNAGFDSVTASGTSGTNTIATSSDISGSLEVGARIRLTGSGSKTTANTKGDNTYTITAISGNTITVAETLSDTYVGDSIYRGLVESWDNKAGAEVASQTTEANRPLWVDNALNSNAVLSFDGTDDYLDAGDVFDIRTDNRSAFSVFNFEDTTNSVVYANSYYSGTDGRYSLIRSNGNLTSLWDIGDDNSNVAINNYSSTDYAQATSIAKRGVSNSFYLNGESQGSASIDSDFEDENPGNHFLIGVYNDANGVDPKSDFYLNGHVSEIIMYNDSLNPDQQHLIEQYQSAKWGIEHNGVGTGATEAERAMASNGFGVFTANYLERLSGSADIVLRATNDITLDLQNDTMALNAGRSISLNAGGNITDASAGMVRTDNGNISVTSIGGNIDLDTTNLEALNGGFVNLDAAGDVNLLQASSLNLGSVYGTNISLASTGGDVSGTGGIVADSGAIDITASGDIDFTNIGLRTTNQNITLDSGQDLTLSTSTNAGTAQVSATAARDIFLTETDLSTDLISYWAFDEGSGGAASDSAGGNDGELKNDATWAADNPFGFGTSIALDGSGDYVDVDDIDFSSGDISGSMWVKIDGGGQQMLLAQSGSIEVQLQYQGGASPFRIRVDGAGGAAIADTTTSATGEWQYLAFTYDGSEIAIYLDGRSESIVAASKGDVADRNVNWGIGARNNASYSTDGKFADVRLYDASLSDAQIAQLYAFSPQFQSGTTVLNAGRDVTLDAAINAIDTGNALSVAAGRNFVNNAGTNALNTSDANARWLVYSANPDENTLGGLNADFKRYNKTYAGYAPASVTETGNGLLYNIAPTLTVTAGNTNREYGDANPAFGYSITGFIGDDTIVTTDAVSGSAVLHTTADNESDVGSYDITASIGNLVSDLGYQFSFTDGTLNITKANLEVVAEDMSFSQGTTAEASYTFSGFKNDQTLSDSGVSGSPSLMIGELSDLDVGNYDLDLDLSDLSSNNYSFSEKLPKGILQITPSLVQDKVSPLTDIPPSVQQVIFNPTIQMNSMSAPIMETLNPRKENNKDKELQSISADSQQPRYNKIISSDLIEIDKPIIDFYDLCSYNLTYCAM